MAITLGGGGGSQINEIWFFVDQGDTFTDSNGAVWLKKGVKSLDTTTYPDAFAKNQTLSRTTDFISSTLSASSPQGLSTASDSEWALSTRQSSNNNYSYVDIASDTRYTSPWPSRSSAEYLLGTGYIKCNATSGMNASVANANNYFAAGVVQATSSITRLYGDYLLGGSAAGAGRPWQSSGIYVDLKNASGTNITPLSAYAHYLHWDPVNRKLYFMQAGSTSLAVLYVYDWSSQTWGFTGPNWISGTGNQASQEIDWKTQAGTAAYQVLSMSGDSTHLYVGYRGAAPTYVYKVRKIPLSGNLSWSSGTDIASNVNSLILQTDSTTFTAYSLRNAPTYYKTVGSTLKFMGFGLTPIKLHEFELNVPIIGEDAPDVDAAKTQYQRIK